MKIRWILPALLLFALMLLVSCAPAAATSAPAAPSTSVPSAPSAIQTSVIKPTEPAAQATQSQPQATQWLPTASSQPTQVQALPSATALQVRPTQASTSPGMLVEGRRVELEWPANIQLGESDLVRLSLVPDREGYRVETEFPDHSLRTQAVVVERPAGYELYAAASLEGVGFEISPVGTQEHLLPVSQVVTWRWTLSPKSAGRHGISISLWLRWKTQPGYSGPQRESLAFSRALEVHANSFLGLSRSMAMATGLFSLLLGGGLSLFAMIIGEGPLRGARLLRGAWPLRSAGSHSRTKPLHGTLQTRQPNPVLTIEPPAGMTLGRAEMELLRALFGRYARLVLQGEFLSGYSGARTFLALPVLADGRADAQTIVKIGPAESIRREYDNYEAYVKDSLPPITARIQHAPVTVRGSTRAAVRYTFIAEPGRLPVSLRQALLNSPDTDLIKRLFETFGPNWWMQRQPYIFRAAQEYDRLLPPHYVLQPVEKREQATMTLDERTAAAGLRLEIGDIVNVKAFIAKELRADGKSLTLRGVGSAGGPALRLRWLGAHPPQGSLARVVADRAMLLCELTQGFDLLGLADPLARLPGWLNQSIMGTRSIIHGDLNLENVLVGPGNFVWLIDFAQTRQGHTLFDFAHLKAELVAKVLSRRVETAQKLLDLLRAGDPLLVSVDAAAAHCLFNPSEPGEFQLASVLASLGALKFVNQDRGARQALYLAAAYWGSLI